MPSTRDIIGDYEILGQWARGAHSDVYVACSVSVGLPSQICSLRILNERDPDGALFDLLSRELVLSTQFTHAQIAQAHDIFTHDQRVCIVSDFVEGESLAQLLRVESKGLPVALAAWIAAEVAQVVSLWHARTAAKSAPSRQVHGDLCPSSIMLTYDGRIIVRDFGIALSKSRLEREQGRPVGHVNYMAPERTLGPWEVDARSDIYSLGMVFAEMLHGRPMNKNNLKLNCSRAYQNLIKTMLSSDPKDRPHSMEAMSLALKAQVMKSKMDPRVELGRQMARHFQHRARALRTLSARWRARMSGAFKTGDIMIESSGDLPVPMSASAVRTSDLKSGASEVARLPPRRLSFSWGVGVCVAVVFLLALSAPFWPAQLRNGAVMAGDSVAAGVAHSLLALVALFEKP